MIRNFLDKVQRKIRGVVVKRFRSTTFYNYLYLSYWHYLLNKNNQTGSSEALYYSARPNPGAGIGHQMANWIAGYWFAKLFELKFAHIPFAQMEWDEFLGWGKGEVTVSELKGRGYKVRRLPLFDENNSEEVQLQRDIIASYSGKKVVFIAEQDQYYKKQYGVMNVIQRKFYDAPARKSDRLVYNSNHFNIAIHVRRGDILSDPTNPDLVMRYLSNDYYFRVLSQVLALVHTEKEIHIYFFSQGSPDDYPEFGEFENMHWCFDMNPQQSVLHMVYADLLITSKSSFSYKPALMNKGIKVCPKNFWHGYPLTDDWVLCDNEGEIVSPWKGYVK